MTRPLPESERTTGAVGADRAVRVGRTVLADRYELLDLLGRGGMAEVHRAHDRALDRIVAVKILPADRRGDPDHAGRLRGEARAAAALSHANAVGVFDVGVHGDEVFVVMEHVEGRTLRAEMQDRGRRPVVDAADVAAAAAAVCDALAAAHERGIVHRDVNPGNVMRCADGTVKLMDFGIARVDDPGTPGRTGTGLVMGTAAYMAPEQVRAEPLDGRADLYALGCSLYEIVTGELPFVGYSDVEVAARRLREAPVPPRAVAPSVPAGLEAVILRALALHPDDRYPDALAMAADLRAVARVDAVPEPRRSAPRAGSSVASSAASAASSASASASDASAERATDELTDPSAIAPGAGESEPWSWVARLGVALILAAVVALLVAGVLRVL